MPKRQCGRILHLFQREARPYVGDAANLRQLIDDEALQRLHILHHDTDQVIGVAGHEIALHDLGVAVHGVLEIHQGRFDLLLETDMDEHADVHADLARVEQRHIAADHPILLQRPHAGQARRWR